MSATMRIKKGDMVQIIAGKDKGKSGKIIAINHKKGVVYVEGLNMITKHTKPSMANQQGGIIHTEGPIDASNVMYLYNGKPARIQYQIVDGKKVRAAKVKDASCLMTQSPSRVSEEQLKELELEVRPEEVTE